MAKRNRQKVMDRRQEKKHNSNRQGVQAQKYQEERKARIIPLQAQNENQKIALRNFNTKQLNVLSGSAGSGKTELCVWWACKEWLEGNVDNIVLTRPDKGLGDTYPVPGGNLTSCCFFSFWMRRRNAYQEIWVK